MTLSGYDIPPGTTVIRVGQVTSNDVSFLTIVFQKVPVPVRVTVSALGNRTFFGWELKPPIWFGYGYIIYNLQILYTVLYRYRIA